MNAKMKTRLTSLLLCLVMLVGMMPTTVMAEDGCAHANAVHFDRVEPSCYGPGTIEYWFCEECWCYFDSADMQVEILPNEDNGYCEPHEMLVIPATGHNFTDDDVCYSCGIGVPIYSKVTSLTDINEEDMYIFVIEIGDKAYAMGIPTLYDCYYGCYGHMRDVEATEGNAVEVTINEDGTIGVLDKNVAEVMFDVNPERWNMTDFGLTTVMPLLPNHVIGAFQSHGYADVAYDYYGSPYYYEGSENHYPSADGGSAWAIDFYTTEVDENTYRDDMDGYTHAEQVARGNIGDNIAEGDLLMYPANFYSVGGAMFTLRFREYPNPDTGVTEYYFICGEDWALEGSPGWDAETDTTPTNDTQYAISLYRYDVPAVDTHTCEWNDWTPVAGTNNHTRTCQDTTCGKTETVAHGWDNGTETEAPKCTETGTMTYTCADCGATKTEDIDALDHDWSDWADDGANAATDTHSHTCNRNCGVAAESEPHSWGNWTPDGDTNHKKTCSVCNGTRTATHNFDNGVVTEPATHTSKGVKTFTCGDCGYSYTEDIPTTTEHTWTEWSPNGNGTHTRSCRCNATETKDCTYDTGVVTTPATHYEEGVKTFTCTVCGHTKTEAIAKTTEHEWSDWSNNNDGTHTRSCRCNANETKDCTYDNGVVTEPATHTSKGVKTYTCTVCGHTYTEDVPVLTDHAWGEWVVNKLDEANTHIRYCVCDESQTAPHNFDNGVVTEPATHTTKGVKTFTCGDCGYSYTEDIPTTTEHTWTDWSDNGDGTHTRSCRCNANETLAHTWGGWAVQNDGSYKRECADCAAFETMTLPEDKPVNTTTNDNAANTNLTNTDIELIENVLTDEEQSQVAEGAEVKVYLKVEDISNETPTEHKAEAEAKAGDNEIGMYLDIDLFKQVGTANETQVTETTSAVTITITIPDNLINTDASVTRTYKIIRVHEDENGNLITDVIEGVFNPENNTFTFETDKFSTYALAYADNSATNTPAGPDSPQTGDNSNMMLWIALLFVSGFGVVGTTVLGKKKFFVK